jgi:folate-binding protein YgfZ
MIGVDNKPSPISEYWESLGYKSEQVHGKKIFKLFDSIENEFESLCKGVGLRDASDKAIFEMKGKDVLDFLHRISTNSIKELQKDEIAHTIFTNEKGRIIDVASVINFSDHQLLICSDYHKEKVMRWIEKYVIMDDVVISNMNGRFILLELLGPQADSFITLICGNLVNELKPNSIKAVRSEGIIFFLAKVQDVKNKIKFYILADHVNSVELVKFMYLNKGPFNFNFIGEEAYNIYKIVYGIPSAPNELNDQYNPHEAKILDFVSFTKGCYIGQEVIARLDTYNKVQKHLCGVAFNDSIDEGKNYTLFDENNVEVGVVTSSKYSPQCKKPLGLAYIRKNFSEDGRNLVAKNGNEKSLQVVVKSFPIKK